MNIKIEDIEYKFVSKNEMIRLLDKIEFLDHNRFYNRKEIEKHLEDDTIEYCIQFYGTIPLSICVARFDAFSDNDVTCLELQSVIPGYVLYFMAHLISDINVMRGKDIWFCVDHSNSLSERLMKFYSMFQKRFNLKRVDMKNDTDSFTFFYSYPCSNENLELDYFRTMLKSDIGMISV